jgi:hypothetical protein
MNIPINTATAPVSVLALFPIIQPNEFQALQPAYNFAYPFKAWVDPNALLAPATKDPDPQTGIHYLDDTYVSYPVLNIDGLAFHYSNMVLTRKEASQYNCPDPSTIEFSQAQQLAGRPVPSRPLQPCESIVTAGPSSVVVQNNIIVAAQAAVKPIPFTQHDHDILQWLASNFGMPETK